MSDLQSAESTSQMVVYSILGGPAAAVAVRQSVQEVGVWGIYRMGKQEHYIPWQCAFNTHSIEYVFCCASEVCEFVRPRITDPFPPSYPVVQPETAKFSICSVCYQFRFTRRTQYPTPW